MKILEIVELPTTINNVSESCYRSYAILEMTIELLKKETPAEVILSLIQEMREVPRIEKEYLVGNS